MVSVGFAPGQPFRLVGVIAGLGAQRGQVGADAVAGFPVLHVGAQALGFTYR